jgi:hypothetical protein
MLRPLLKYTLISVFVTFVSPCSRASGVLAGYWENARGLLGLLPYLRLWFGIPAAVGVPACLVDRMFCPAYAAQGSLVLQNARLISFSPNRVNI